MLQCPMTIHYMLLLLISIYIVDIHINKIHEETKNHRDLSNLTKKINFSIFFMFVSLNEAKAPLPATEASRHATGEPQMKLQYLYCT